MNISFDKLQNVWSIWELRSIILFSLFVQSFLILVSPFRRKTANGVVSLCLWLAYLLADWAATFSVGIISHSQDSASSIDKRISDDLMTLWAPILIVHLGGPDTITALALEDNELWKRHLLQLLSQLGATGYIFYKAFPNNALLIPTILMFLSGLIKYGERVYSLYLASVDKFRESLLTEPDPGPNYAKLMEEYTMRIDARLPADIERIEEPEIEFVFAKDVPKERSLSEFEMVQDAYKWFKKFKGLVADLIYSKDDWRETRAYFSKRTAEQAFRIVEIELNFIYEILYTKMVVIRSWGGYLFRLACFVWAVVSLCLWFSMDKSHLPSYDVTITYTLLGVAITLDVIAFFMLVLSDWSIAHIKSTSIEEDDQSQKKDKSIKGKFKRLIIRYLEISNRRWSDYSEKDKTALSKLFSRIFCFWRSRHKEGENSGAEQGKGKTIPFLVLISRTFNRRWSESIQQFNLIDYSVNARNEVAEKLCGLSGLKDLLDGIQYVSVRWFSVSLRDAIFSELKAKSDSVDKPADADKICMVRGEWVLANNLSNMSHKFNWEDMKPWITNIDYDESLILWHIATEVCYSTHGIEKEKDKEEDAQRPNDPGTHHTAAWWPGFCARLLKSTYPIKREKNDDQQKRPETQAEENDTEQQKGPETPDEENDAAQQKGPETQAEENDAEQQIGPETPDEAKAAPQQKDPHTLAKEKVAQQEKQREISKTVSDYMLYLLIRQPKIMTAVAGIGQFRFRDTCAEAKKFLKSLVVEKKDKEKRVRIACSKLLEVSTDIPPKEAKGDRSKSLLFEGCRLAKELNKLEDDKWMVIHKVWVEMLCYAATRCSGNAHAAQLSKGGQLLTFVWMLMVHLGLGKQFLINEGNLRAKLVIGR